VSGRLTDVSLPPGRRGVHSSADRDFAADPAHCALSWHQQPGQATALDAITAAVPGLLPGADAAAVAVVAGRKLQITAAHGPPSALEATLYRTLEPNLWNAGQKLQPASVAGRWPVSGALDHHAEMGSLICVPLGAGTMMFGNLLVLGFAADDAFTSACAADVTTLAIHASIALAAHRQHAHLQQAALSRDVIGQAKGILMGTRHLTADQAFAQLQAASQHSNVKVRQVAENLCRTGELGGPPLQR
jgi:GAF domain-containing protein